MTTLANYIVVRDTKFELRRGQERRFTFDIPGDIVRSGGRKRPIIAFFADPSGSARNLRCEFEINYQKFKNYTYSGGVGRGHFEVVNHENLKPGESNTIEFKVLSGDGHVDFSDVILWFQRDI